MSFKFVECNLDDFEHKCSLIVLSNDKDVQEYLGDIFKVYENVIAKKGIDYSNVYMVYLDDKVVGLVTLYYLDNEYEICYAVLPEYRLKHYSSDILKEFTDYVFENTNINELYLYIKNKNVRSVKIATNNGYLKQSKIKYKKVK